MPVIHSSKRGKFYKRNWKKKSFSFYWFSKACNTKITIKPTEKNKTIENLISIL